MPILAAIHWALYGSYGTIPLGAPELSSYPVGTAGRAPRVARGSRVARLTPAASTRAVGHLVCALVATPHANESTVHVRSSRAAITEVLISNERVGSRGFNSRHLSNGSGI